MRAMFAVGGTLVTFSLAGKAAIKMYRLAKTGNAFKSSN